jgi:N,N'-diacetyllegionaminate synthase
MPRRGSHRDRERGVQAGTIPRVEPLAVLPDRCAVIAEVAQGHDGSLGLAHSFIDLAAVAGVDAIKFQTHIAAAESSPDEPWRVAFSYEDASRYAYWQRMEFTEAQWTGLREHCEANGLGFISSAFSVEAVDLLRRVGVSAWKISSGESLSFELLRHLGQDGLPILISTGMSTFAEIEAIATACREAGAEPVLLQCTSMYPTPPERLGLNVLTELQQRFGGAVGLSDHSGTIYPGLAAVGLGAVALEVHITFSRTMFGPDAPVSLEPAELRTLVEGVRFLERARQAPVDKDGVAAELADMRSLFGKSLVSACALPAGTVLTDEHLTAKKPATGIPASERAAVVGRTLRDAVDAGHVLAPGDLTDLPR